MSRTPRLEVRDAGGRSALHYSVIHGLPDVWALLLARKDFEHLHATDRFGSSRGSGGSPAWVGRKTSIGLEECAGMYMMTL